MNDKQIICYPQGNVINVTEEQFNKLNDLDLVRFDDEFTEENPNGQWGFMNSDEKEIRKILNS